MPLTQPQIIQGFETIAIKYDLANDIMTLGLHRLWRRKLINNLSTQHNTHSPLRILDLGTGTGDLAISLAKRFPNAQIFAVDPATNMLNLAQKKASKTLHPNASSRIQWIHSDLAQIPIQPTSLDAIVMAWVIRNILNPANALTQLLSLLRPQGTIHILESGRPSAPIMKILYPVYSRIFPYLGSLVSPQKDFYEYYRRSVDAFPYHKQFITLLENSGYLHPHSTPILGGILYLYTAQAHTKNPQILPQRSSHTQSIDTP